VTNVFNKFIEQGKSKLSSLQTRLSDVHKILIQLDAALDGTGVSLEITQANTNRGIGYKVELATPLFMKKFLTVTIPQNERELYYLERQNEVVPHHSTDELINTLGNIVSSVQFWQELEELKKMELEQDPPF
jgi:hypothetical protein